MSISGVSETDEVFVKNVACLSNSEWKTVKQCYKFRLRIINYLLYTSKLGWKSAPTVCVNDIGSVHLSNCPWSSDASTCGPDSCSCQAVLRNPRKYFAENCGVSVKKSKDELSREINELCRRFENLKL